jgi:hypothetical protein
LRLSGVGAEPCAKKEEYREELVLFFLEFGGSGCSPALLRDNDDSAKANAGIESKSATARR